MSEAIVALITAIISAVGAYLVARDRFRDELQKSYDERLRRERVEAYAALWRLTGAFPMQPALYLEAQSVRF